MNIKNLPMEERPMEKILSTGVRNLSNTELLAVIIRTGTKAESAIGLSERILSQVGGGIKGLLNVSPEELMEIPGVGIAKACALSAAVELTKRLGRSGFEKRLSVSCAREAAEIFMEDLRFERKEHFKTLLLDTKGKVIHIDEVSIGDLTMAPAHPREIFQGAVKRSAASIILVHNHPSGDPTPSNADTVLTERLVSAGKLMGIRVQDHIIIGDGEYYSFAGMGLIED